MMEYNPDRWREIDRLFAAALDRPPGDRIAFLEDACRGDSELGSAVLELLNSIAGVESFLETPVVALSGDLWEGMMEEHSERNEADHRGERVGPYRIVRTLARGGMGTVFLAERADGEFERLVALKLLRRGLDTDDIIRRFRAERQILASLDHPHIARLIDGGATEDGRPYLVMEYVQGRPITEYCDAHRLSVHERLRLFVTVARAVSHAHQNLVVHRDLKPSNILVTGEGTPKLLDFGIAKLLDDAADDALQTRTGLRLMTPEYASPEQRRGDSITTASDVYQLGVLLYRLLTGTRPFEAHRLREQLRGDLDNIVMTALRSEPERRYPSVAQLTEDIERHLGGLPVLARGDKVGYRLRKFVGRHRTGVGAAAIILLMLLGYAVTVTVQSRQVARERDRARIEAAKATAVKDFVVGLFEIASPDAAEGEAITARDILDRGAERIRLELSGQPAVRAELLSTVAQIYGQLEMRERGLSLAEEALSIRRDIFGPDNPELAASLLQVGKLSSVLGTYSDTAVLREAVEATRLAHGTNHPFYAEALFNYAYHGSWAKAPGQDRVGLLLDSAIAILRTHPDETPRALLAEVLTASAYGKGSATDALSRMREALEIRRSLYGDNHPVVAQSLSDIALALETTDPPESARLLRSAIRIYREAGGEAHPVALRLTNNLAGVLRDHGELVEAEALYREVLRVRGEKGHDRARMAYPLFGLGRTLVGQGRGAEAERYLREVLPVFPEGDGRRDQILLELAEALTLQGRVAEASSYRAQVTEAASTAP